MARSKKTKVNKQGDGTSIGANSDALSTNFPRAGFIRRLAAMIYDALIATAVWMLASLVMSTILTVLLEFDVLSKGNYEHVYDLIQESTLYKGVIQGWTIAWVVGFFLYFWKNGGQTLGMRAWRLKIFTTRANDSGVTYARLFVRLLSSLCGLGTLLVLIDVKNKQSLQDRVADTEVLYLSKEANDHKSW